MSERCTNTDLLRALGKIEGKLEVLDKHHDRMNRIDKEVHGLEHRVSKVETKQAGLMARVAIITSVIATGAALIIKKVLSVF